MINPKENIMIIKKLSEIQDPQIWNLTEHEDIIITREGSSGQRVLLDLKTYQALKESATKLPSQTMEIKTVNFELNPNLQSYLDRLQNNTLEQNTENEKYSENYTRNQKTGD